MTVTTPQGSAAPLDASNMTQAQAVDALKAKLASRGATAADTAVIHSDDPNVDGYADDNPNGGEAIEGELTEGAEGAEGEPAATEGEDANGEVIAASGKIILPDGSEVTVEDARKSYLRVQDYTRKTQELAQQRNQLAAKETAAAQQVNALLQNLNALQETEPDWAQVATQYEPAQVFQMQANWKKQQATVEASRRYVREQQIAQDNAARAESKAILASGEYNAEWKDPKKLETGLDTIMDYALSCGFDRQRLANVSDANTLIILDKARQWDALKAKTPLLQKAVTGKPAAIPAPGSKANTRQAANVSSLQEAYNKNPNAANATALFKAKNVR